MKENYWFLLSVRKSYNRRQNHRYCFLGGDGKFAAVVSDSCKFVHYAFCAIYLLDAFCA